MVEHIARAIYVNCRFGDIVVGRPSNPFPPLRLAQYPIGVLKPRSQRVHSSSSSLCSIPELLDSRRFRRRRMKNIHAFETPRAELQRSNGAIKKQERTRSNRSLARQYDKYTNLRIFAYICNKYMQNRPRVKCSRTLKFVLIKS